MTLRLADTEDRFGLVSIILHWTMAAVVIGLFVLGLYMTGLDYVHPWYTRAPDLHRSLGMVVLPLVVMRFVWRALNRRPGLASPPDWEQKAALLVHRLFYVLLFAVPVSGYLISTANGRGVGIFGWFEVPALFIGLEHQEDVAGAVHLYMATAMIVLTALHTAAALKHHLIDRDRTLMRMLGAGPAGPKTNNKEAL